MNKQEVEEQQEEDSVCVEGEERGAEFVLLSFVQGCWRIPESKQGELGEYNCQAAAKAGPKPCRPGKVA